MKICIIGTGYVGLVTGTCLADFGLLVTCVDQDETKISLLNSGGVPIYEPNLAPLIEKNISAGRLTFTTDLEKAIKESKVIFIAVGTPSNNDGSANLAQIEEVAKQIALSINNYQASPSLRATEGSAAIPPSSPSPLREEGRVRVKYPFDLVSNPEFRNLDLTKIKKLLKSPIFLDLRNLYEPAQVKALGFIYDGVGRK